jgi:hypothetical protein
LFAEHFLQLICQGGRSGVIVPTGIATDSSTKAYFDAISSGGRLASLYDFENREAIFPEVHRSYKFALLTLGDRIEATDFVFFASAIQQLNDNRRHFELSADDITLINPNTRTCPVFRSQVDAELTKKIYSRAPVLIDTAMGDEGNPWGIRFATMFHMTNDSSLMSTEPENGMELVWEAKMTGFWDHRDADIEMNYENATRQAQTRQITDAEHQDPRRKPAAQFWTDPKNADERIPDDWGLDWIFCFKRVTAATNWRTLVPCVVPRGPISYTLYCLFTSESLVRSGRASVLYGALGSLVVDYCLRHKTGQPSLPLWCPEQIAMPTPNSICSDVISFVSPRIASLVVTADDIALFAPDTGNANIVPSWDPSKRAQTQAELDAFYANLYGLNRDELRYILDPSDVMGPDYPSETFRVLKTNELRQFGEYRTQRLVLEAWDRLFEGG